MVLKHRAELAAPYPSKPWRQRIASSSRVRDNRVHRGATVRHAAEAAQRAIPPLRYSIEEIFRRAPSAPRPETADPERAYAQYGEGSAPRKTIARSPAETSPTKAMIDGVESAEDAPAIGGRGRRESQAALSGTSVARRAAAAETEEDDGPDCAGGAERLRTLQNESSRLRCELENLKLRSADVLTRHARDVEDARKAVSHIISELGRRRSAEPGASELRALESKLAECERQSDNLRDGITKMEAGLGAMAQELAARQDAISELRLANDAALNSLNERTQDLERARQNQRKMEVEAEASRADLNSLKDDLESLRRALEQRQTAIDELTQFKQIAHSLLQESRKAVRDLEAGNAKLREERDAAQGLVSDLNGRLEQTSGESLGRNRQIVEMLEEFRRAIGFSDDVQEDRQTSATAAGRTSKDASERHIWNNTVSKLKIILLQCREEVESARVARRYAEEGKSKIQEDLVRSESQRQKLQRECGTLRGAIVQLSSKMKEQQGRCTEQQSAEDFDRAKEAIHGEDVSEHAHALECKRLSDQFAAMELELQRLRARNVQHEKELDRVRLEVDRDAAKKAKTSEKLEFALEAREQAEDLLRKRQRDDQDTAGKYERRLRGFEEELKGSSEELRLAKQTLSDVSAKHREEISEKQALIDNLRHTQKLAEEQIKALEKSHEEALTKIRFLAGELKEKHEQAVAEKKQAVEKATAELERARAQHKAELASLAQDLRAAVAEKEQAEEQMHLSQEREAAQDVRIEELVALLELAQKRICALQRRLEESSEVIARECDGHKRAAQEAKTARQLAEKQLGQLQLTSQSERSAHEELVKTLEKSLEDARTEARGCATHLSELNLRYAQELAKAQARADQAIAARESAEAVFEKQRYELIAHASRAESEASDLKRRLKEMRNEVVAAEDKLREQLSKAISAETARDSVRQQLAAKGSEIAQIKEKLRKVEKSKSAEAENLRSALLAGGEEVERLRKESDKQKRLVGELKQALERRESEFSARTRRLEKQLLKREKELAAVISAMKKKQVDLDHAYDEVAGLEEVKENMSIRLLSYEEDASQTVQSLEAEIDCLSSERKRLRDELHGCRLTLESTEEALAKMKRNASPHR